MERVILLRKVVFDGRELQPGTEISVQDGYPLIKRGIARKLTPEERSAILDDYMTFSRRLFKEV